MHSEGEIRRAIKPLVDKYGELNTSEVKQLLETVLVFDNDDLERSDTRNETKIIQRIGNIVAHQNEKVKIYEEGFLVDKSNKPARFIAVQGLSGKEKPISAEEIKNRKKNNKRINRKTDWDKINERNSVIGLKGEEFVVNYEIEKIKKFDPLSVGKVIHLSVKQGDGCGYDISSINEKGETLFIEVKTTSKDKNDPFYMTENERSFFEENINGNVFIYRVYNFDKDSMHGKIQIISARELLENYEFDPITYKVRRKK